MKTCRTCGIEKPETEYYIRKSGYILLDCNECHYVRRLEYTRSWRLKNHDKMLRGQKKWAGENLEKYKMYAKNWLTKNLGRMKVSRAAVQKVRQAIRKGIMIRPNVCSRCGLRADRIEGAHYDYSKPLDVVWLCVPCHRKWDAIQPKTIRLKTNLPQNQPLMSCCNSSPFKH